MTSTNNIIKTSIFDNLITTIETFIEKTCIQEITREKREILPTSTVTPCRSLDVDFDTINVNITIKKPTSTILPTSKIIPLNDDTVSQHYIIHIKPYQPDNTMEYCDMV